MRPIGLLVRRRLRHQPLRAAIAAITVAAGVSLAIAVNIIDSSVNTSIRQFEKSLAGVAPLRVVGPTRQGGITESTVAQIEAVDGVAAAVPMIQAVTLADDGKGKVAPVFAVGIDCRARQLIGRSIPCTDALLAGAGDQPLAVGNGVFRDLGIDVRLRTNTGLVPLQNVPGVGISGVGLMTSERIALFSVKGAQHRFGRDGTLDVVYIEPEPGADLGAVRRALDDAIGPQYSVLGAGDVPAEIKVIITSFVGLIGLVGLITLGTGVVLVHNTVRLSVEERRRQLAIVAAVGGTARVVAGGALVEAGLMGLVGGVLGAGAGTLVARPMMATLSRLTEGLAGVRIGVHFGMGTIVLGAVVGLGAGLAAAVLPARRALRLDVAAELSGRMLREEAAPRAQWGRSIVFGAVTVVGLTACVVAARKGGIERWQATLAPMGLLVMGIGTLLLTASVATLGPRVVQWARPVTRYAGAPTRLALANLVRDPRRTVATIAAVTAAVGTYFTTANFNRSARDAITEVITTNLHGVTVSASDPTYQQVVDAQLSAEAVDGLARLPGVARIERGANLIVGDVVIDAFENPWLEAEVVSGSKDQARFESGEVLIGTVLARERGLRAGDRLLLPTPQGEAELPIEGVWINFGLAGRTVTMPYHLFQQLYGPRAPSLVNVIPEPGVSYEDLRHAITSSAFGRGLYVQTPAELVRSVSSEVDKNIDPIRIMERWLFFVAFVAVLSTLLLIGVQRQREMGLLAAVGMKPSELGRMVLAEGGLVGLAGTAAGAVFGVIGYYALTLVLTVRTGLKNPIRFDITALFTSGVIATLVALAAAAFPAWRASRIEVVEALQYE